MVTSTNLLLNFVVLIIKMRDGLNQLLSHNLILRFDFYIILPNLILLWQTYTRAISVPTISGWTVQLSADQFQGVAGYMNRVLITCSCVTHIFIIYLLHATRWFLIPYIYCLLMAITWLKWPLQKLKKWIRC